MGRHVHRWVPIRRGYPQEMCKCGALSVLDLKVGRRTIYVTPGGTEVVRWTKTQDALQAGDVGMDIATGRGRLFVGGAAKNILVDGDIPSGPANRVVTSVAVNTVLNAAHDFVAVTASVTITFPTAVGISGKFYTVKSNADGIVVAINLNGAETMDGAVSGSDDLKLTQRNQSITPVSDGANWLLWART